MAAKDAKQQTPLHYASKMDHLGVVKAILASKDSISALAVADSRGKVRRP